MPQPRERRPPGVAVLDARCGEPAELVEHLGVAEVTWAADGTGITQAALSELPVDAERHQDVLGRSVPGDQRRSSTTARAAVGDVGATAAAHAGRTTPVTKLAR